MKFLKKDNNSIIVKKDLDYTNQNQRKRIRDLLLEEQFGFCAYSERYALNTDSVHVEHFDPRLKNTDKDNYNNWYAVLAWMNEHKSKNIEKFLPILNPCSSDINNRIKYSNGEYKIVNENEKEFLEILSKDKWYLSFITALEVELELNLFHLIN